MIKLIVVRHAESQTNSKHIIGENYSPKKDKDNLSQNGKLQAQKLVKKLNKYKFDEIIISPLKRTKQTLEPYLKNKKVRITISDLTIERNAGIFAGKPKPSIKEFCDLHKIQDRVNFKPENGESILEVYNRAKIFLDFIKSNFKNKSILVCGHVNFLECLDILIENKNIKDFYNCKRLGNCEVKEYTINN